MNFASIGKTIKKKIRSINMKKKTVENKVKLPHVKKKTKNSLYFLFWRDQNHCSNLTSKIMKMCEQIIKKDSAPIQFIFFEL